MAHQIRDGGILVALGLAFVLCSPLLAKYNVWWYRKIRGSSDERESRYYRPGYVVWGLLVIGLGVFMAAGGFE